jgi:anti-anti-sigma factor
VAARSEFEIGETLARGWARVSVNGELDISTALTFRRRLRALEAANTNVSVNLSHVEFIDCAGARAVIDAVAQSCRSSWCVLVEPNMPYQPRRLFDLLKAAGAEIDLKRARGMRPHPLAPRGPDGSGPRGPFPRQDRSTRLQGALVLNPGSQHLITRVSLEREQRRATACC